MRFLIYLFFLLWSGSLWAQTPGFFYVQGRVTDAESGLPIVGLRVIAPSLELVTETDSSGRYALEAPKPLERLEFRFLGYVNQVIKLSRDSFQVKNVVMKSETEQIKEVTVKPKKYRNKDNPAVALIELVVRNRDKNRPGQWGSFHEEQYEKLVFGIGNFPDKIKRNKMLKGIKFIWENVDTTRVDGIEVVPMYVQENILDVYYRNPPKQQRKYMQATRAVHFDGFADEEGVDKALRYLNEGVDIYENFVTLVTDQFLSPVANNAPLFYRYYPMDTTVVNGRKIVHLAFFPRNKQDFLLQGDLYVALDSTYPVTGINFTINPNINLNWVQHLNVEQKFDQLPGGQWALSEEDYRLYFGLTARGVGMYGERFVRHRDGLANKPIPADSLFESRADLSRHPMAERRDTAFWLEHGVALSRAEQLAYINSDSLVRTKFFRMSAKLLQLTVGGYINAGPAFEVGPINTFYAFNGVEGSRLRFGGRTTEHFSKKIRFDGFATYGTLDERWKFGSGIWYAVKGAYNKFPYNVIRASMVQDVRVPGQGSYTTSNLGSSVVRGANDRFLYSTKYDLHYEHEFINNLSLTIGADRQDLEPAGALSFIPSDGMKVQSPIISARPYFQLRFAPGEKFYQDKSVRSLIDFNYIFTARYSRAMEGFFGGQYNYDEITASLYKYTDIPPIGYNKFYVEAGAVFGTVPYPLLTIHRANQSYQYQQFAYNLMNFMEFISDRHVAVNMVHHFNGFFLNKIPLVKRLKLREILGVKAVWGTVTERNLPANNGSLYQFPTETDGRAIVYPLGGRPYIEASVGVSNIFRIFRIDLVRRLTYLDHPGVTSMGVRGTILLEF